MTGSKLFDFLGRVLMAAVFVNALPAKFTNFAETAGFIASKGIPEPLASVLLVAAIVVLIAGSILLVFGSNTVLGASLLLLFLVPTTLIFHTFPVDSGFAMNLALIGGLILAITRAWAMVCPASRTCAPRVDRRLAESGQGQGRSFAARISGPLPASTNFLNQSGAAADALKPGVCFAFELLQRKRPGQRRIAFQHQRCAPA